MAVRYVQVAQLMMVGDLEYRTGSDTCPTETWSGGLVVGYWSWSVFATVRVLVRHACL